MPSAPACIATPGHQRRKIIGSGSPHDRQRTLDAAAAQQAQQRARVVLALVGPAETDDRARRQRQRVQQQQADAQVPVAPLGRRHGGPARDQFGAHALAPVRDIRRRRGRRRSGGSAGAAIHARPLRRLPGG
jgi:hypothetical protein